MVIVSRSFVSQNKTYWSYAKNDPFLFPMDHIESTDIDTELDFKIAEAIYKEYA
jgi:CMP-N-acetylneuraminic acid synthetase